MSEPRQLRIPGVTRLDELAMRDALGDEAVHFESTPASGGEHGEIATTTAIVMITLAALRILALHIVTPHSGRSFSKRVEVVEADGTRRVTEIKYKQSASKSPEADVLAQLAAACGIDLPNGSDK